MLLLLVVTSAFKQDGLATRLLAGNAKNPGTLISFFLKPAGIALIYLNYNDFRFFPFGANGMLAGSATVFFAYIGFDSVASTAEEVRKHPISLLICHFLFDGQLASNSKYYSFI